MSAKEMDALLRKIAEGDNVAFEQLYIRTKNGVYAFLRSYFNNHADTEDAMQTVYLKVKRGIASYQAGTNGRAWLLQIAKNHALSELKKRRNEVSTEDVEIVVEPAPVEGTVTDAMERVLSQEERQIVILHILWKYKHREIGEMLGCPTGTVTSKYKRAIKKLQEYLKEVE